MNSIKTNSTNYTLVKGKAIAGVALIPEGGQFRAYVAWEWEDQAINGHFAIIESNTLVDKENLADFVNNIADYGNDVTHKDHAKLLFANLFQKVI